MGKLHHKNVDMNQSSSQEFINIKIFLDQIAAPKKELQMYLISSFDIDCSSKHRLNLLPDAAVTPEPRALPPLPEVPVLEVKDRLDKVMSSSNGELAVGLHEIDLVRRGWG